MSHLEDTPASKSTPAAVAATYPDLAGKVAVVTGGSRGIGAATAAALAANGAAVAVVGRDAQALGDVTRRIENAGGKAISLAADCTVADQVNGVAAAVTERLGPADILAAFAGGSGMPVPTVEETPEHWREVVDSDLTSAFLAIRAFLPRMVQRGQGVIVTMASSAARQAALSNAAYAAAKAGVVALTRHLAGEYARQGIRLNCLAPAAIENDRMRSWMTQEQRQGLGRSFPLGRLGQPEDVAAAALFLASDASSWITGATLDVAGGKVML